MNDPRSFPDVLAGLIDRVVSLWKGTGIPTFPGVPPSAVEAVWRQLGQRLSTDVRALYSAVNGFAKDEMDEHFWSFWSLGCVSERNVVWESRGVHFSDFLIDSHRYLFRYEAPERSSVWHESNSEGFMVATSVADFLQRYLDDPGSLLLP